MKPKHRVLAMMMASPLLALTLTRLPPLLLIVAAGTAGAFLSW